jgi:hypothetical protein
VPKQTKLQHQAHLFLTYQIDKFEFYDATKWYPAQLIADTIGTDVEVVRDRRRYLRQLAKVGAA